MAQNPALLEFCVEGLIGRATSAEATALAEREAALELDTDAGPLPFRRVPIEQAAEPDSDRRAALEGARLEATEEELNPLYRAVIDRGHELAGELGWSSMTAMCSDISGIDLRSLAREAERFLDATDDEYAGVVEPLIQSELGDRRSAPLRPAGLLPRAVARRPLSGGPARRDARRDALRPRDRRLGARDARRRDSADQVTTSLLCRGARSRGGLSRDLAPRRARRLRDDPARGRARPALRPRAHGARLRAPPPRRQLGDRGVRVPDPASRLRARVARPAPRRRGSVPASPTTPAPRSWCCSGATPRSSSTRSSSTAARPTGRRSARRTPAG